MKAKKTAIITIGVIFISILISLFYQDVWDKNVAAMLELGDNTAFQVTRAEGILYLKNIE